MSNSVEIGKKQAIKHRRYYNLRLLEVNSRNKQVSKKINTLLINKNLLFYISTILEIRFNYNAFSIFEQLCKT